MYRESIITPSAPIERATLAQVVDPKGELAWGMYDPHSPLAVRILSTDEVPPSYTNEFYTRRFARSLALREPIRSPSTTGFRLFNGEGDLLPGLVCDIYSDVAVLQFDGQGPSEFWEKDQIAKWLLEKVGVLSVIEKSRRNTERTIHPVAGAEVKLSDPTRVFSENGAKYKVNLEKGQKTGFFLDQRDNRLFVRSLSKGRSVLNLFSYTGGFSVSAGLGHADKVASLDVSAGAIESANENWALNELPSSKHFGITMDAFEYLNTNQESWDHVLVDPPSMSHSEFRKEVAIQKYIELFAAAAKKVKPLGELSLSSCSSHVSFEDFFKVIAEAMSLSRRRGQVVRVAGQGPDHPFPHACPELRYLKFVHLALD